MLGGLFKRYKPRVVVKEEIVAPKTLDIVVANQLTGKRTAFFAVDATLAAVLRAAGIAEPYVKPQEVAASNAPRFFVEESTYTGAPLLSVTLPSGEKRSYTGDGERKTAEKVLAVGPIPENVWAAFEAKRRAKH